MNSSLLWHEYIASLNIISLSFSNQQPTNTNCGVTLLEVYSILGEKVATLINSKKMAAGSYEVEFSASGAVPAGRQGDAYSLSSGVYFYKLTAGEFTKVKKMILLR